MNTDSRNRLIIVLFLFLGQDCIRVGAQQNIDEERTWTLTNGQKSQGRFIQFLPPSTGVWAEGKGTVLIQMSALGVIANTGLERIDPSGQELVAQLTQKFPGPYCRQGGQLYPHWVKTPTEILIPKAGFQEVREEGELDLHGLALGMSDTKVIATLKSGGFTIGDAGFVSNLDAQVTKELNHRSSNPDKEIDKKLPVVIRSLRASNRISNDNTTWQVSLEFTEDVTRDKDCIVLTKVEAALYSTALPREQIENQITDSLIAKFGKNESDKGRAWGNVSKEGNWRKQGDKIFINGFAVHLENVPLQVYLNNELKKQYKEILDKAFSEKANQANPLKL